jgi:aspartyl/asparaginyl beta-hydroxylase (cupin superfamily)
MYAVEIEKHWEIIRDEIKNVTPIEHHDWFTGDVENCFYKYPFVWNFEFVEDNCNKCPGVAKLLKAINKNRICRAGYSLIAPNVNSPVHVDEFEDGYIGTINLGLDIPGNCYLHHAELGTFNHENGKMIFYDTRIPHQAVNNSDQFRCIFYAEVYKL